MKASLSSKVFIIAEAGSNWKTGRLSADLGRAKALIDVAAEAGADAVKFQTFRAETVYVPNAGTSDYLSRNGLHKSITDIFKEMAMPYPLIRRLAAWARKRKIEFMSSFFSPEDFKAVNPFVRVHKIASYEITHPHLLARAAQSGKPLILSTGAATGEDIRWALDYFRKKGGKQIVLMQCTAKYPAPFTALNLRVIPELRRLYKVPVGFSDHSRDPLVGPVAAVALGAVCLEKHFTLDNKLSGPDHAFAVTPLELKALVRAVRECERALGQAKKFVLPEEKELRDYAQRAVQAVRDISKGERLSEKRNVAVLRPGKQLKGAHPKFLGRIEGRVARHFIPLGTGIHLSDVRNQT